MEAQAFEQPWRGGLESGAMKKPRDASAPVNPLNPVRAAVVYAGGTLQLADLIGVTDQTIRNWMAAEDERPGSFREVPFKHILKIFEVTGLPIARLTGVSVGVLMGAPANSGDTPQSRGKKKRS